MSSLQALHLLKTVARLYQQEREVFSKEEILKKINEIKYLSSQKKVPRLSLRKEILNLEQQLQGIFELEKKLLREKKKEKLQVTTLKQEINYLKKKLSSVHDQDLHRRVEKLSHLLGDYLAQKGVRKELQVKEKSVKKTLYHQKEEKISSSGIKKAPWKEEPNLSARLQALRLRIQALRQELELQKQLGKKGNISSLQQQINLLEKNLQQYSWSSEAVAKEMPVKLPEVLPEVKHKILFTSPEELALSSSRKMGAGDLELEKKLPLPPPSRMKRV